MSENKAKKDDFSKARKKHKVRRAITSLLLAFAVLYLPVVLIASGGASAKISLLTTGAISDSIEAEGLILKQENELYLPFDGTYTKEVSEGERIPTGCTIATIVEDTYATKFKELDNLANEILLRKKEGGLSSGIFTRDLKNIEDQIGDTVEDLAFMVSTGKLENLEYYADQITKLESARDQIVSGSMSTDQYTEELENQYKVLQESLSGKVTEIKSSEPGYISFQTDGYEGVLTEEVIRGFSPEEVRTAIKQFNKQEPDYSGADPFAKLVTGNQYTLVTVLDEKDANRMRGLSIFELVIDEPDVSFTVNDVEFGETQDGKTVVYMGINKKLGELVASRRVNFNIKIFEYQGLMVPVKSLLNYEAYPIRTIELARVKDNWIEFIEVRVLAANQTHAIIEPVEGSLNLFDYYAVNPKKVEEGQVVR